MAREAQSGGESAALWAGRFRLLAIVVGVSAPLIVVYLIWRSLAQSELDPTEVIEVAEKLGLPQKPGQAPDALPARSSDALPAEPTDNPSD